MNPVKFLILVAVLTVGGYLGYQMIIRGKSLDEISGNLHNKITAPYPRAKMCLQTGDYKAALEMFREALEKDKDPESPKEYILNEKQIRFCYKKIAHCLYQIAKRNSWPVVKCKKAIKAYEEYRDKYENDMDGEEFMFIHTRIEQIKALGRML